MKRYLTLVFISLLSFSTFTQENETKSKLDKSIVDWANYKTIGNIQIEYRFANCDRQIGYDKEIIEFRFTNNSTEKVSINWHMYLYYNGICKTCDYPEEYKYSLTLSPNQILTGDCGLDADHQLTIFSKFNDPNYTGGSQLTDFELHDLTFTTIK